MAFDLSPITNFYNDQNSVVDKLMAAGEVSLASDVKNVLSKSLVVISASYFESFVRGVVESALNERVTDRRFISFAKKKGIDRQFHTWFDWNGPSSNPFFSLFGPDFSEKCKTEIKGDGALASSSRSFLDVVILRNEIMHENFLTFPLTKSADEVLDIVRKAKLFLDYCERVVTEDFELN